MATYNRMSLITFNGMKKYLFSLLCLLAIILASCSHEEAVPESRINGCICPGAVHNSSGMKGFKVSLEDPAGVESSQVCITGDDGTFSFSNLKQNKYYINAQREGWEWDRLVCGEGKEDWDNLTYNHNVTLGHDINIQSGQVLKAKIFMYKESVNNEFTITDISGKPISRIMVPNGATTIGFKIYNGTLEHKYWHVGSSMNDIIYSDLNEYVFEQIVPSEGTLAPGDAVLVSIIVNPEIYYNEELLYPFNSLDCDIQICGTQCLDVDFQD